MRPRQAPSPPHRQRRPGPAPAGHRQPPQQHRQVLPRRRPAHRHRPAPHRHLGRRHPARREQARPRTPRRHRRHHDHQHPHRHPRRQAATPLPPFHTAPPSPRPRHPRHRPRAGDLPNHHRTPPRHRAPVQQHRRPRRHRHPPPVGHRVPPQTQAHPQPHCHPVRQGALPGWRHTPGPRPPRSQTPLEIRARRRSVLSTPRCACCRQTGAQRVPTTLCLLDHLSSALLTPTPRATCPEPMAWCGRCSSACDAPAAAAAGLAGARR